MGFHHRKLLLDSVHYGPAPSPLQSPHPLQLPQPSLLPFVAAYHINHHYLRILEVVLIVLACTIGVAMFLYTTSRILRYYYSRRNNRRGRNTPSPILFDIYGNSPSSDDDVDEGPVVEHPIWFIRTVGLEQSIIDSIAVFKFRKGEGLIEGTECSVCLGEFQEDESLRLLPKCCHAFHVPCIDTWLRSHKNCPLCRAPAVHDAGGAEVNAMVPDSNSSGQNQETQMENLDGESSGITEMRIEDEDRGDNETPEKILHNCDKMNCSSSVLPIGSKEVVEEEIQPVRRSVSMDSFSGSLSFHDVVDLNCDLEGSETHFDDKKCSSSKDVSIAKQGSGGSSTIYKLASIGKALQKRTISTRFSQNRNFLFSTHCRSQSSTLPL